MQIFASGDFIRTIGSFILQTNSKMILVNTDLKNCIVEGRKDTQFRDSLQKKHISEKITFYLFSLTRTQARLQIEILAGGLI